MTQELRKLAEAAKGWLIRPSIVQETADDILKLGHTSEDGEFYELIEIDCENYGQPSRPLAEFIAAANPAAILALLDRVEKAEKAMEQQKNEWLSWHAKREQLEKDAARYQVLRNPPYSDNWGDVYAMTFQRTGDMPLKEEELDFAVDRLIYAAMEASK